MARAPRARDCAGDRDGEASGEDGGDGAGVRTGGARDGARCTGERDSTRGTGGRVYRACIGRSELRRGEEESDGSIGTSDANPFARIARVWKHALGPAHARCSRARACGESGKRAGRNGHVARLGNLVLAPREEIQFGKLTERKDKTSNDRNPSMNGGKIRLMESQEAAQELAVSVP